ncbi:UPF0481 protein [Salvia divinorum]|uniref:UPF0481 protein n=1 Tax=Salvia divinorum TaxID=28513 RepID=A0ABD1IHX5_SALDI
MAYNAVFQPQHQNRYLVYKLPFPTGRVNQHLHEPKAFGLSPYFSQGSDAQLQSLVEPLFQTLELQIFGFSSIARRNEILREIADRMPEIRSFYAEPIEAEDYMLATWMLRGACLLVCYMQNYDHTIMLIERHLGSYGVICFHCDIVILGNQIPFWLITLLRPGESYKQMLLDHFSNPNLFYDGIAPVLPWEDGVDNLPKHYLEALHRVHFTFPEVQQATDPWELSDDSNRSATELILKGIRFKSCSHDLRDIRFTRSGKLYLPKIFINADFEVLYSNLIAYEISPEVETTFGVLSYIDFLKSLVVNSNDVKVLKEAKILYTILSTDDEIVDALKRVDTYRLSTNDLLRAVKAKIDRHCRSRAKTWVADLKKTHFKSPWTVIALFAAIFVIGLYIVQTVCAVLSVRK